MPQSNELRVFISSTFRDLQEEREHLVKKIFPEIRALCRERGVTFTEVDLRWGITEEEAEREGIIRICLDEIDRCRPYFIGILGERYGWTPPRSDAERVADDFPVLADALMHGASITEMEIVHGVLDNPAMAGHAFFYFRKHDSTPAAFIDTDPDITQRLRDLKNRIRESGFSIREDFTSPVELGVWLEEDLRRVVDANHPESEAPGALELVRRAQQAFAASRTRAYIANPEYLRQFEEFVNVRLPILRIRSGQALDSRLEEEVPSSIGNRQSAVENCLVLTGASGLGKSSLVAHLVDNYRTNHPTAFNIEHYVGASQTSGSATSVIRHIVEEIRERFGITEELPAKPEEMEKSFPNWLFRAEHFAKQSGIEMLIVIDAVNQLDEAGRRLTWLPKTIPAGIKLLVSTTPGACAEHLANRAWVGLDVAPIDDMYTREQIVGRYLGEFHKSITPEQTRRLTTDAMASSPLYLRVVSEELRLHGEHETLDDAIDRYVGAVDLPDLFDRVLARFEQDYGVAPVERLMSVIWASRGGLSELELMELAGLSRIDLSRLLFAIDYHFLQRDGLLGFFHDYLRRAVVYRYLNASERRMDVHCHLAAYFKDAVESQRTSQEFLYQLHASGQSEQLVTALATIPVFKILYEGETRDDVLSYWSELGAIHDVELAYRRGLERWEAEEGTERGRVLRRIGDLLTALGHWKGAMAMMEDALSMATEHRDRREEADVRRGLGRLRQMRGEYDESLDDFSRALDLYTELGDRTLVGVVWVAIGVVYASRGEYDQSLESYKFGLSISEDLGDRRAIAVACANMGNVYADRGEYDRALECYQRQLSISEELGDRSGVSTAIGNMGLVYADRGEYDRALESYQRQLSICEAFGNRRGVCRAIGNMGIVYSRRGEYDRALESYQRELSLCEELDDPRGVSVAIGNMGIVYAKRREYDRALESFYRATKEHRVIGFRYGLTYWLQGTGQVLVELDQAGGTLPEYLPKYLPDVSEDRWRAMAVQQARVCAEECIAISDELSKPDTQFSGRVLMAQIDAAYGDTDVAVQRLTGMLADSTEDERRAELHYRLWKLGVSGHATAALSLYEKMVASSPAYYFGERIEELTATPRTEQLDAT